MSSNSDPQTADTLQFDPLASEPSDDEAPLSETTRALPPSLRERYQNLHLIAEGAMGAVFRGWDPQLGRAVAIKLLKGDAPDDMRRFLKEAKAQARIQHTNVCHVYDAGMADGEPYIAMEFIEGAPLDRAKAGMSLEQKVKVVREVAAALHEAHRLGLIHRDIKPGNIMIAPDDDGAIKPYVVDFGLAREVAASGESIYNIIAGTPAYMSPEQAEGTTAALDRRSDVYSLGVTLYELLAGRTPFVGSNPLALLTQIMLEDVPALHTFWREVPSELETIVMTCLERDPSQRYESARALGEDLQRFLDGEPILAKPASFAHILISKAKKNKGAVLIAGIGFCVALVLSGLWIKTARRASEQAMLARELGEDIKYVELFLRSAYGFPVHDIEREKRVVRERLEAIERRMVVAGRAGDGPGHYALGRGHLALHDYGKAKTNLERAMAVGYVRPEVHYALGLALGGIYREALDRTLRIEDRTARAAAIKRVEQTYRDPALQHLKESGGTEVESKIYIDALIALYEHRYDDAASLAIAAYNDSPWLYEAKKLEGDARFESGFLASESGHQDEARRLLTLAIDAYTIAIDMARSDALLEGALAEAWIQRLKLDIWAGQPYQNALNAVIAACENSLKADPMNADAFEKKGRAYFHVGYQQLRNGQDPRPSLLLAITNGQSAKRISPGDAISDDAIGNGYTYIAKYERKIGSAPVSSLDNAIASFRNATRIQPTFAWPWNDTGVALKVRAEYEQDIGNDPRPYIDQSVEQFVRAASEDPSYVYAYTNVAFVLTIRANYQLSFGLDPLPDIKRALEHSAKALQIDSQSLPALNNQGWAELAAAQDAEANNRDPTPALDRTETSFRRSMEINKDEADTHFGLGSASHVRALYAIRNGVDPTSFLDEAHQLLTRAAELDAMEPAICLELGRLAMTMARNAKAAGKDVTPYLNEGASTIEQGLKNQPRHALLNAALAELIALRAEYAPPNQADTQYQNIPTGLLAAERALGQNPNLALAMAARGALFTARGRLGQGNARKEDGRLAVESLEKAFSTNPLLPERFKKMLAEARQF